MSCHIEKAYSFVVSFVEDATNSLDADDYIVIGAIAFIVVFLLYSCRLRRRRRQQRVALDGDSEADVELLEKPYSLKQLDSDLEAPRADKVTKVVYVEVNNNQMQNVAKYTLANSGRPFFDVGIIFAANINYDTSKRSAYLYFNQQVTNVLNNRSSTIQPLQQKGIKVLLSILGNHQGAGIANFPNQGAAQNFAQQLADAVKNYGLDGIDFDDEYADYGNNGTGQPNSSSFVYLVTALRQLLGPEKIISFYYIGPASNNLSYNGVTVGSKINYSYNPYYGTYSQFNVPGLGKSGISPAALDITSNDTGTATRFAQQTLSQGYGVYMMYNLDGANRSGFCSAVSQVFDKTNTNYQN